MWFFRSPEIVFGEDALRHLDQVNGRRAFIVTDAVMVELGFVKIVQDRLAMGGIVSSYYSKVEPEPSLQTVYECAAAMRDYEPDWILGLGGGSCIDAAKAAWFHYERPDVDLAAINPIEHFGLGAKAHLITIPTTAGSGSEVSHTVLLSDPKARRKLELASFELVADLTIVDPQFSAQMPPGLTADTGMDVLTHAVEGYNNLWSNDFTDGLCLQAARMVFKYLPRAVKNGVTDMQAREKMASAATIAGMVICNSNNSIAHSLGHAAGAVFHLPHGRLTGLILPYTIEYIANGRVGRFLDLAHIVGLIADDEDRAAACLASAIRDLLRCIDLPVAFKDAGISRKIFQAELEAVCDRAEMDPGLVMARRFPKRQDLVRLFEYAYDGKAVDF